MSENAELYRRLNVPFLDAAEANAAIEAFRDDVEALRAKHRIPDLYVILSVTYKADDGREARAAAQVGYDQPGGRGGAERGQHVFAGEAVKAVPPDPGAAETQERAQRQGDGVGGGVPRGLFAGRQSGL